MKILTLVLWLLVVWRMVWVLKWKWYWKVLLIVFAGMGAFKFQIFRIIGGHYFSPDLPDFIIMTGAWLYGAFYFVPPLLGVSEIVRFFKWRKEQHIWNKVNLGIALAALVLSGVACFFGAAEPKVTHYIIEHPEVPAAACGMKAVFLTDLHIDHTTAPEKVRALVQRTNALKGDIILLGGDLMDGKVAMCGKAVGELNNLKAPMGVFQVPGNHEFYSGFEAWKDFWAQTPCKMLINENLRLANGIVLAGSSDRAGHVFFRKDPAKAKAYGEDFAKTLRGVRKEDFVLLLSHRPKAARKSSKLGADLQLSGHTHGGMIRGFDILVGLYNGNWVSGRYQAGPTTLLVSNGTWLWRGFPLRLGRPGEILVVTLKKSELHNHVK